MNVIKRDGREVQFDKSRIVNALKRASKDTSKYDEKLALSENDIHTIANRLTNRYRKRNYPMGVEDIQDDVETELMKNGYYEIARNYIKFRRSKEILRKSNTTDAAILSLISLENEEIKQENSNKNPTINSVQRDYMAGEVSKDLTKRFLLPKEIIEAHEQGLIHFHDADYFAQHMHNCFSGGTKFITDSGIRRFNSFNDGDEVYVRDMYGQMRKAIVHKYENQKLNIVTIKNCKMTERIICTPNHRWILKDGSITTDLSVGDKLWLTPDATEFDIECCEDAKAFCLGFVVGDGTDTKNNSTKIRLCGEKIKYKNIFLKAGYSEHSIKNSNDVELYKGEALKQTFLDGKVWRYMTAKQKNLCFKGYYSADGARQSNRISTADRRVCNFIEETSGIAGYYISSKKEDVRNTNYKEDCPLYTYHFITKQPSNWNWKVINIEPYRHGEVPVWCVEEPITHSFTLDKGIVTGNCCLVNLEDMLQNGTVISETMIEKPHSFSTACTVATQIIAQVASSQYGGQSVSLAHLAPFVDVSRKKIQKQAETEYIKIFGDPRGFDHYDYDRYMTETVKSRLSEEIRKGIQIIQYQTVTLQTTNGQAPFITLFMYLGEAKNEQEKADLALIIQEVLTQRIEGVKNENGVWITPAFPKLIYVLEEENISEDKPYFYLTELAAKCTAKRMVPDYISEKVMKELKGEVYTCMGCRSFLTPDRFTDVKDINIARAKNYIVGKHKYYGRFNQGVVTVNLPDIALSAKNKCVKTISFVDNKQYLTSLLNIFDNIFEERMELCHKALRCRHERLRGTLSDVAPILWQHGALARFNKGETIDDLLYGGYSTISLGYAGLWECVYALIGKKLTEPEGQDLGLHIMQKLNQYTNKWKQEENIDYSIYGTPLESTTYKFAKCLQKRFGIIEGVTDKNYITNSYHIHVTEKINAFDKLAIESEFQKLSPGGAISYVEVPNMQNNIPAVLQVMKFIYDHIMYAELNTKSDYCQCCDYNGEIQIITDENGKLLWQCPRCGNTNQDKMNVARRTCGYIGTQFWNQGRTQEIKERVLHL